MSLFGGGKRTKDAEEVTSATPCAGNGVAPFTSAVVKLAEGVSDDERAGLRAFGIDADLLHAEANAMRAALGGVTARAPTPGVTAQLRQLANLNASGALSDDEFAA